MGILDTVAVASWIVDAFLTHLILKTLLGEVRTNKVILIISYVLGIILPGILGGFIIQMPIVTMVLFHVYLAIVILNYQARKTKKIIFFFLISSTLGLAEVLVVVVFYTAPTGLVENYFVTAPILHISRTFMWCILTMLAIKIKPLKKTNDISWEQIFSAIFLFTVSCLIANIALLSDISPILQSLVILLLISINIFVFYMQKRIATANTYKLQSTKATLAAQYHHAQVQTMQASIQQVKTLRHDIKEHLHAIQALAAHNNTQGIETYINDILKIAHSSEIYSETGNITFDSIVNYKLAQLSPDINCTLELCHIPDNIIKTIDMVTIIGNILDNAIYAIQSTHPQWLHIKTKYEKNMLLIKVSNPYTGALKMSQGQYLTQKKGNNHGLGLGSVKTAAENYNSNVEITHDNNIFTVSIVLFL